MQLSSEVCMASMACAHVVSRIVMDPEHAVSVATMGSCEDMPRGGLSRTSQHGQVNSPLLAVERTCGH